MAEKYYVRPVIDIRDIFFSEYEPEAGETLPVHIGLHNVGGMDARDIVVRLHAAGPDSRQHQIGEIAIDRLGTGFDAIEHEGENIEFVKKHGNTYGLVPGRTHIAFPARQTLTIEWEPPAPGYYKITAEVQPGEDYTILSGRSEADILVR